jgi:hypothetical protein
MIVTFLYRVKDVTYYGKYIGYISDHYEDGLDIEIQRIMYPYVKNHYHLRNQSDFYVGIISYQTELYTYFSPEESKVFQLLFCNFSNEDKELYLHGEQQTLSSFV